MEQLSYAEIATAAELLSPSEREQLIWFLQATLVNDTPQSMPDDHSQSLFGKYASPQANISTEELEAYLHEVATEWEEDFADWPRLDLGEWPEDLSLRREDL